MPLHKRIKHNPVELPNIQRPRLELVQQRPRLEPVQPRIINTDYYIKKIINKIKSFKINKDIIDKDKIDILINMYKRILLM